MSTVRLLPALYSLRAPLIAGLLLILGLGAWGSLEWRGIHDRYREHMRRFAAGVSQTVTAFRHGTDGEDPTPLVALKPMLARVLEGEPQLRFAALLRDGQIIVSVGESPPALQVSSPVGERVEDDLYLFWFALDRPPGPAHDRPPPPRRQLGTGPPPPLSGRPIPPGVAVLVTGIERTFPAPFRRREIRELAAKVGVATLAALALLAAWIQGNRRRGLAHRLTAEQAERVRWQELSLAASGLAHETKNPLGAIRGLAQRIADNPEVPQGDRERASQIVDQADRAVSRVGEFLSYARVRDPEPAAVEVRAVLARAAAVLAVDLEAAGVPVGFAVDDAQLWADEEMLLQILVNLMLNSIEASRPGDALTLGFQARGGRGRLSVEDQGCGIDPGLLGEVFKPYVTGRPGGHGLGLALVRRFVEQHGWRIGIRSEPGRGTRIDVDGIRIIHPRKKNR